MNKTFSACPRCGSTHKGSTIYQCRKCAALYCLEVGWFSSSGCGHHGYCPECREKTTGPNGNNRVIGTIR